MREIVCIIVIVGVAGAYADGLAQGIDAIERDMIDLVDGVSESIVSVAAISARPAGRSVGCGIVFDRDGLILTTASVVGYARQVEIGTRDGLKVKGTVVGSDATSDLAIIRAEDVDLKPAQFGDDETLPPGSLVFVLGNAFGSLPSVSMGVASSVTGLTGHEGEESMLRLSVAINPGDIGGPVVNTRGEVIGVVIGRFSLRARTAPGFLGTLQPSSMSVAMPARRAIAMAGDIMKTGRRELGYLGVQVLDLSKEMKDELGDRDIGGVVVTDVVDASPAESIGIVPGDVITTFGTRAVESVSLLREAVRAATPGDVIHVTYRRGPRMMSDGVRIARLVPQYVRQASFGEHKIRPEDIQARIEDLKAEIEILKNQLKDLEKQQ